MNAFYAPQKGKHIVASWSVCPYVSPSIRYLVWWLTLKLLLALKWHLVY